MLKTRKKKKGNDHTDEFNSIVEHLKVIIEELESWNFSNIKEVLGMYPTLHYEGAIGFVVAMTDSIKPVGFMPSHTKKIYKESNKVLKQNRCLRGFHKELRKEVSTLSF